VGDSLKRNDISCSFLIARVLYWSEAFRDSAFGAEKAEKLDRAGSSERAVIPYSLHSDFSVSVLSPLEMVEAAVTLNLFTEPGQVLASNERATIEGALRGVTSVPAWQLMSEHEIGSLEAWKLADFVLKHRRVRHPGDVDQRK
jgi:predicted amidohydrolase YtcJ